MSFARRHLPAIVLCAAILFASGAAGSRDVTGRLANPFLSGLGLSAELAEILHGIVRKIGHFMAYGLFATLALRSVRGPRPLGAGPVALAGLWALLLAAADESLQRLSPDRTSSAVDVAIDVGGACAGLALAVFLASRRDDAPVSARAAP